MQLGLNLNKKLWEKKKNIERKKRFQKVRALIFRGKLSTDFATLRTKYKCFSFDHYLQHESLTRVCTEKIKKNLPETRRVEKLETNNEGIYEEVWEDIKD